MWEENRLGTGDVKSLLFSLALPAIIGQLVSLIYNMVDKDVYRSYSRDMRRCFNGCRGYDNYFNYNISIFCVDRYGRDTEGFYQDGRKR